MLRLVLTLVLNHGMKQSSSCSMQSIQVAAIDDAGAGKLPATDAAIHLRLCPWTQLARELKPVPTVLEVVCSIYTVQGALFQCIFSVWDVLHVLVEGCS
eukprot:2084281-Amphidinium_carterae.1